MKIGDKIKVSVAVGNSTYVYTGKILELLDDNFLVIEDVKLGKVSIAKGKIITILEVQN